MEEIRANLLLLHKKNEVKKEDKRTKFNLDSMKMYRIEKFEVLADYKKNPNKISEELNLKNKKKIIVSLISIFVMLIFLTSIFYLQLKFISFAFKINRFRIIETWLIPSLFSLFILSFIISFVMNFVRVYLCFKIIEPENKILKLAKEYIETEEIRYMYSISNFLTKYRKDINFNDKKYQLN